MKKCPVIKKWEVGRRCLNCCFIGCQYSPNYIGKGSKELPKIVWDKTRNVETAHSESSEFIPNAEVEEVEEYIRELLQFQDLHIREIQKVLTEEYGIKNSVKICYALDKLKNEALIMDGVWSL